METQTKTKTTVSIIVAGVALVAGGIGAANVFCGQSSSGTCETVERIINATTSQSQNTPGYKTPGYGSSSQSCDPNQPVCTENGYTYESECEAVSEGVDYTTGTCKKKDPRKEIGNFFPF